MPLPDKYLLNIPHKQPNDEYDVHAKNLQAIDVWQRGLTVPDSFDNSVLLVGFATGIINAADTFRYSFQTNPNDPASTALTKAPVHLGLSYDLTAGNPQIFAEVDGIWFANAILGTSLFPNAGSGIILQITNTSFTQINTVLVPELTFQNVNFACANNVFHLQKGDGFYAQWNFCDATLGYPAQDAIYQMLVTRLA